MFRQGGGGLECAIPRCEGWFFRVDNSPPPVELKSNIFKNGKLKAKRQTKVKKSPTVFRISENKKDGIQWFQVHLLKFVCSNSNCVIFGVLGSLPSEFPKLQLPKG